MMQLVISKLPQWWLYCFALILDEAEITKDLLKSWKFKFSLLLERVFCLDATGLLVPLNAALYVSGCTLLAVPSSALLASELDAA